MLLFYPPKPPSIRALAVWILLAHISLAADNTGAMSVSPSAAGLPPAPREPQLLRFRLRQMFFMVTLASLLCAALAMANGPWPMVIVVAVLLVAAHVFGNVVGTRLRNTSHEVVAWRSGRPGQDPDHPIATQRPYELERLNLPPETPLASHDRIARGTMWFVVAGLALGLLAGAVGIGLTIGSKMEWAGWAVGVISCGVLGAWLAFLGSTFSSIARHAWRHANDHGK